MNINHQNNQNISFGNVVYGAKAGYNKYMLNKVDRPLFKNIEKSNTHVLVVTEKGASLHPQVFDKNGNAQIYNPNTPILEVNLSGGVAIKEKTANFFKDVKKYFENVTKEFEFGTKNNSLYAPATKDGKVDKNFTYKKGCDRAEDTYSEFWDYSPTAAFEKEVEKNQNLKDTPLYQ